MAQHWLKTCLQTSQKKNMPLLAELCDSVMPAATNVLSTRCPSLLETDFCTQLMQLLVALLDMYRHDILNSTDENAPDPDEPLLPPVIRTLFLFAMAWTLAGHTPRAEWQLIEDLVRSFSRSTTSFPESGKFFSSVYYARGATWLPWEAVPTLPTFAPCFATGEPSSLTPTAASVRLPTFCAPC